MRFFESEMPLLKPGQARFHVVPVPYEKTVSYGNGTAKGPGAILEASSQLERFDGDERSGRRGHLHLARRGLLGQA